MKVEVKKNILKDIEKIKTERKLPKEVEKKIFERVIANWAIGISIIILIMTLMITANFLSKMVAILVYNICAIIFLIFSIIVIEVAYKKDSGELAITAIEILVLSIFTLFAPYTFIRISYKVIYGFMALISAYYIFKIIMIYCKEKKSYLTEISDITDIIKKESKDELAKQELEKRKVEQQKKKQTTKKKSTPKKKTTTKKANTSPKSKTTTKKTSTTTKKKTVDKESK